MSIETIGKLNDLLQAAEVLAKKVNEHCYDWTEGRAYAHSVLNFKARYLAALGLQPGARPHKAEHDIHPKEQP